MTMTDGHPHRRLLFIPLIMVFALAACSVESRHRLWQTLDPAGYKHAHSEVFNPQKYRSEMPQDPGEEIELSELPPLQ